MESIDLDRLYKAFEDKEPKLVAWLDEAAEHLRNALVTIENLFDPQVVILGGPVPDLDPRRIDR